MSYTIQPNLLRTTTRAMLGTLIFPGDLVDFQASENVQTKVGPGIYKNPRLQTIIPANAGLLSQKISKNKSNQVIFIESNSKRYIPQTNDFVIGTITGVIGESYKVSLQHFSTPTILPMMAFPNATKKNRPNLKNGQVVYARVSQAIPEIDIELECIDPTTGKEGGFGLLDESGYLFDINLNFARELLFNPNCVYLDKLAKKIKFEIAIGINGKVWLKSGDGLTKEKMDIDQKEGEDEDSNGNDNSKNYLKDLKNTLAASKFLIHCQHTKQQDLDSLLSQVFSQ